MTTSGGFFSQFSEGTIKKQYAENVKVLTEMLNKATKTDKKVNGYTKQQLTEMVEKYKQLAK